MDVQQYLNGVEDRIALEREGKPVDSDAKLGQGTFTLGRAIIMAIISLIIYKLIFGKRGA